MAVFGLLNIKLVGINCMFDPPLKKFSILILNSVQFLRGCLGNKCTTYASSATFIKINLKILYASCRQLLLKYFNNSWKKSKNSSNFVPSSSTNNFLLH